MTDKTPAQRGKANRRKGADTENEIRRMHADVCEASKKSRSGYTGQDLRIAGRFWAEVKSRKSGKGFKLLDEWLGENDLLFLRRDRARPIVVMPWATYALLARAYAELVDIAQQSSAAPGWILAGIPATEEPRDLTNPSSGQIPSSEDPADE